MACKSCSSENQQYFSGELTVAFPGVQRLNLSPVYGSQRAFICLDCGFTELVFPAIALQLLRKGMNGFHPMVQFDVEHSRFQ